MYVYYERFPGATQEEDLTELVLSSNGGANLINWNNAEEKAYQVLISNVLKQVPFDKRHYDGEGKTPTHVWSFFGVAGMRVITVLNTGKTQGLFAQVEIKEIKNLQEKCKRQRLDAPDVEPGKEEIKFKEEEFFYAPSGGSGELSGEALFSALAVSLGITVDVLKSSDEKQLKRIYRVKAMEYHPDRNNGDGSRMSELNMLMRIYSGN